MAGRSGEGASADDLWQGLKIRMDGRQASYRRSWLRAKPGEPARTLGGKELTSDLRLACRLYLRVEEALRREIRDSFGEWTAVRGRMLAKACTFAEKLAGTCDDRWLRLGLAAVSIDDNGTDFRDTYVVLGTLYLWLSDAAWNRRITSKKLRRSPPASRTSNKPCSDSNDRHTSGRPSHPS